MPEPSRTIKCLGQFVGADEPTVSDFNIWVEVTRKPTNRRPTKIVGQFVGADKPTAFDLII